MENKQEGCVENLHPCDDKDSRKLLLKEYEILTTLYLHEDNLREKRITVFIIILLGLLGVLKFLGPILTGILAILTCIGGYIVHRLGQYWVEVRRQRALFIEKRLGTLRAFSLEKNCFSEKNGMSKGRNQYLVGRSGALIVWISIGVIWLIIMLFLMKKPEESKNFLTTKTFDMIIIQILGFYLIFIGTWRLATATRKAPIGADVYSQKDEEQAYKPWKDLCSPHKVILWMCKTLASFNKPGDYTDAVILHKKFNWGLMWLLAGIIVQFISSCVC